MESFIMSLSGFSPTIYSQGSSGPGASSLWRLPGTPGSPGICCAAAWTRRWWSRARARNGTAGISTCWSRMARCC